MKQLLGKALPVTAENVMGLPPLENELTPHCRIKPEGSSSHPFAARFLPGPTAKAVEDACVLFVPAVAVGTVGAPPSAGDAASAAAICASTKAVEAPFVEL